MTDLKTTAGKIEALGAKIAESRAPLGEVPAARIALEGLFDEGTFVETDALARHRSTEFGREHDRPYTDGVITGYGIIEGRKVCAYAQDDTIFDGTMGEIYGEKVVKLYDLAIKTGVPIVAMTADDKPRAQEGIVSLAFQARIFAAATKASGLIPQITVAYGNSILTGLSDVVIGRDTDADVKTVLSYLPSNNKAETPRTKAVLMAGAIADNITEEDRKLEELTRPREVAEHLFDNLLPLGHDTFTAFGRLEGRAVGIVAHEGDLSDGAASQAARFIRLCDAFNIPIILIGDIPELTTNTNTLAQLAHAYAAATVGKLTVTIGRSYGNGYVVFGPKDLGADLAYAWPTAEIAVADREPLGATLGVDVEGYFSPYHAAERGLVDAVIEPGATRGYLIEGLRLLERKLVTNPTKKHGNIYL